MSVTPSGLSERFPIRRLPRQGSILNKDLSPDKKHDKKNSEKSPLYEFDPTGLVQRCVIIQRDENGFGLTVSGDNPVFVQSVKEDGAAVRAGVQQGDRIIKVNGSLVTHSNHVEVVRLIKSGSYVALTVLGRPPGSPQIPFSATDGDPGAFFFPGQQGALSPNPTFSPYSSSSSCPDRITSPMPVAEDTLVHNQKVEILRNMLGTEIRQLQQLKEKYVRNPTQQLLRDQQEVEKHIHQLQEQLSKATGSSQDGSSCVRHSESLSIVERLTDDGGEWEHDLQSQSENMGTDKSQSSLSRAESTITSPSPPSDGQHYRDSLSNSPKTSPKDAGSFCESMDIDENQDWDSMSPALNSPQIGAQIIGAEDDDFDTEVEQIDVQCDCFQSIESVKSRPAHLVAFLHHVVSQFDAAPLLCYLYADLYNHTNPKDHRRVFVEFCHLFLEKGSNLKVQVPEWISTELERKRGDLTEEMQRSYMQGMQASVLSDVKTHLEDFRQKRNMGMTIAENELAKLDRERMHDRVSAEQKERLHAEHLLLKIDDVLMNLSPSEEDRSNSISDVILIYMKHLGVKVKDSRNLDRDRRIRVAFFPKKKPSIKKEKESVKDDDKKKRFQSILDPIRRTSKQDRSAIEKARLLYQKQMGPYNRSLSHSDHNERTKPSPFFSEGSDANSQPAAVGLAGSALSTSVHDGVPESDTDPIAAASAALRMAGDNLSIDSNSSIPKSSFDFPFALDQVMEEDRESERSLETATPPCTPKPGRRMDGHGYGAWTEPTSQSQCLAQTDEDQMHLSDVEQDPANWQQLVSQDILSGLKPHEIKRQEVINELFNTERAHIRMLKVLDVIFYQKMMRDGSLPAAEVRSIFSNLDEILQLHISLNEQMRKVWKRNENFVVDQIGEDLLSWFSCSEEEKFKRAAATFCSNQPFALELIKSKQKKDARFQAIIQEAQSNPQCRRLQLKDIIPTEMQRLTKYPLLLENIAKNTDPEQHEEKKKVKKAAECCRQILNFVNQAVKEAENKQRLEDYQRRLDLSSLKQSDYPLIEEFRNLDLTKRNMIHEGPLTWRVNKDKTIDLYTLLLEDILVLSQKQDERLVLKCHSKNLAANADTKHIFSPIIKLSAVLVREVATDNKAFFVISTSTDGAQIYELVAQTVSERKTWQYLITQTSGSIKPPSHHVIPEPAVTEGEQEDEENLSTLQQSGSGKVLGRMFGSSESPQGKEMSSGTEDTLNLSVSSQQKPHVVPSMQGTDEQNRPTMEYASLRRSTDQRLPHRNTEPRYSSQGQSSGSLQFYSQAEAALRNLHTLKQLLSFHMLNLDDDGSDGGSFQHLPEEDSCLTSPKPGADGSLDCTVYYQGETTDKTLQHQVELDNGTLEETETQTSLTERTKLSRHFMLDAAHGEEHNPDSATDDSGERFYDAPEDHADEHRPQQNCSSPNRDERSKSQARVSGHYITLDGFPQTEGSSTDETDMSVIQAECSVDYTAQSTEAREDCNVSGPCNPGVEFAQLLPSLDVQNQILQLIRRIESNLKHLKEVELEYYNQQVLESAVSHEQTRDS
ncbi:rho guanine nucleotide exchange factor 12-like isoform X1 [Hemiscyllium ocellatum]|uniref:rho guanine nucleotide exchange factor 12-like isoform X1 n=1 Tax=Hemiscyllium ocellatum TaxID=170820 RepID=UPI002965D698|nr:rho guanine nucleotide exchange factor 12-like isoform X1 [Hemiscyllium ocellatum]